MTVTRHQRSAPARGSGRGVAAALVLAKVMAFVTSPIMARILGPTGRGQLAEAAVYNDVSAAVLGCGIAPAVGYHAKEQRHPDAALMASAWQLGLLSMPAAVAAGAVLATVGPLGDLGGAATWVAFGLIALSPVANTVGNAYRSLLLAHEDLRALRNAMILAAALRFCGILLAALTGALGVAVAIVLVCYSDWAGTAYAAVSSGVRPRGPGAPKRELLRYGLRSAPGAMADLANARLDQLLIAALLGPRQLALYVVAVTLNALPLQLGRGLGYASFSRVREREADGRSVASRYVRHAWATALCGGALAAVGIAVLLRPLYGSAFAGAVVPALILVPGTVAYGVSVVQQQVAAAIGRPSLGSLAQVAALVATVGALPLALHAYGIAGAAAASTMAYVVRTTILVVGLRRCGVVDTRPRLRESAVLLGGAVVAVPFVGRRLARAWPWRPDPVHAG